MGYGLTSYGLPQRSGDSAFYGHDLPSLFIVSLAVLLRGYSRPVQDMLRIFSQFSHYVLL